MRNLTGERFLRWGTEDSGHLGGICCLEFLSVRSLESCRDRAESECTSRGTNLLLPRTLRLPQCSLVLGPLSPLLPFSSDRWGRNVRTPDPPLILDSLMRDGSIHDSDLGFLGMTARAFGALRAAPLLSRTLRESDKIGESAWRLWRVSLCWGSTLGRVKNLGLQARCLDQNDTTPYHLGGEIRRSYDFPIPGLWSGLLSAGSVE